MTVRVSLAIAALALTACDRHPSGLGPVPSASPPATIEPAPWAGGKTACKLIEATWMPDGFVGVSPAGSASAAALNAQMNDAVQTIRITYTGTQIKMKAGSQISFSSYSVIQDTATSCKLQNGSDTVVVTFGDADHCVVNRTSNPYAAQMKMKRVQDASPSPTPPVGWIQTLARIAADPKANGPTSIAINKAEGSRVYSYAVPSLSKVELTVYDEVGSRWTLDVKGAGIADVLLSGSSDVLICSRRGVSDVTHFHRLDAGPLQGAYVTTWDSDPEAIEIDSKDTLIAQMKRETGNGAGSPASIEAWRRLTCNE